MVLAVECPLKRVQVYTFGEIIYENFRAKLEARVLPRCTILHTATPALITPNKQASSMSTDQQPSITAVPKRSFLLDLPNELLHEIILHSHSPHDFRNLSTLNRRFHALVTHALKNFVQFWITSRLNRRTGRADVVEVIHFIVRDACMELVRLQSEEGYMDAYNQRLGYYKYWPHCAPFEPTVYDTPFRIGRWTGVLWKNTTAAHWRMILEDLFVTRRCQTQLNISFSQIVEPTSRFDFGCKFGGAIIPFEWLEFYYKQRSKKWGSPEFDCFGLEDAYLIDYLFKALVKSSAERGLLQDLNSTTTDVCKQVQVTVGGEYSTRFKLGQGSMEGPLYAEFEEFQKQLPAEEDYPLSVLYPDESSDSDSDGFGSMFSDSSSEPDFEEIGILQ
ncbi:hypothetical protein BJ508DRAFT_314192 [Ascobolus immersus RN42]|uniref:F-box domain-containing protein n=1 Tax=Ascobolus immersus RN42 TaxID=1160509 RepID=A0A3N4HFW5_ASCIM|nr:hypothetical protein BJ508DRAFT_314192 [Ascobolus immersus RN42]